MKWLKKKIAKFRGKIVSKCVVQPALRDTKKEGVCLSYTPCLSLSIVSDLTNEKISMNIELPGEFRDAMEKCDMGKPIIIEIYQ